MLGQPRPGFLNLLATRERVVERRLDLHPHDYERLKRKYRLPAAMRSNLPFCGWNPMNSTYVPCPAWAR